MSGLEGDFPLPGHQSGKMLLYQTQLLNGLSGTPYGLTLLIECSSNKVDTIEEWRELCV